MAYSRCLRILKWQKIPRMNVSIRKTTAISAYSTTPSVKSTQKTVQDFKNLITDLEDKQRHNLETALSELKVEESRGEEAVPVTNHQLRLALCQSGLPFLGFGFLDNVIMILAGEYIDMTIGISLGISTMAAAAIGNLISDLLGLGLADSVESLCRKLGIPNPNLTISQLHLSSVLWAQRLGRVLGITIGCIIGMAPLLWFDDESHHHHDDHHE